VIDEDQRIGRTFMRKPKPHRMTQAEFDADPKRAFALSQTAPVELTDDAGKVRMGISCGAYLDENDCVWCGETKSDCDALDIGTCAGSALRKGQARIAELEAEVATMRARLKLVDY
jgi:hypothetical protein